MATKSYTDLEQSRKLAKILPVESADMYWSFGNIKFMDDDYDSNVVQHVLAWSLAALLSVLPKIVNNEPLFIKTSATLWHIGYQNTYTVRASNTIDACYELIVYLHELNLL